MFALGLPEGSEWLWIILAVVVLFGPRKIPELARSLGRSIGEFKRAKEEFRREMQSAIEETHPNETKLNNSKSSQIAEDR